MTSTPSTDLAAARRRQVRAAHAIFAAGDTIATLALFNFARRGNAEGATARRVVAVDDDNNPGSGDIFTQNAQDPSTA